MTTNNSWNSPNITGNGQLLIGSNSSRPVAGTLTPGTGISIVNNPGSITISVSVFNPSFIEDGNTTATPLSGVLNLFGSAAQGLATTGSGNTVTFANLNWTTIQQGVGRLATNLEAIGGTVSTAAVTPLSLGAKLGAQTIDALPVSVGPTQALSWLGPLTNGQLLIGSTGNVPLAATLTAGTGISITNGSGSITIIGSANQTVAITNVSTSPYAVLPTDYFLSVNTTIPITVQLPNAPATGRIFTVKDATGNSQVNNISVTTVGGTVTIDGTTTYLIGTNYESIQLIFNGTSYEIF